MEIQTDQTTKKRINKPYYCYSCEKVGNRILVIPSKEDENAVYCQFCGSDFIQIESLREVVKPNDIPEYPLASKGSEAFLSHYALKKGHSDEDREKGT